MTYRTPQSRFGNKSSISPRGCRKKGLLEAWLHCWFFGCIASPCHHTHTKLAEPFTLHEHRIDCDTALKSPREAQRVVQSSPAAHVTCLVCNYLAVFVASSSVSQAPQIMWGTLPYHGCVLLRPHGMWTDRKAIFFPSNPKMDLICASTNLQCSLYLCNAVHCPVKTSLSCWCARMSSFFLTATSRSLSFFMEKQVPASHKVPIQELPWGSYLKEQLELSPTPAGPCTAEFTWQKEDTVPWKM